MDIIWYQNICTERVPFKLPSGRRQRRHTCCDFSKLFRDFARAKFPTFLGLDGPTKVRGTKLKLSGFWRSNQNWLTIWLLLAVPKEFFASKVGGPRTTSQQPFWITREQGESDDSYHRRVIHLKTQRNQPMIYRFGKGSTLGFPRKEDDVIPNRTKGLTIHGIPRTWNPDDVSVFLSSQEWSEVNLINHKGRTWFFHGKPPEKSKGSTYWRYETDGEKPLNIEIQVAARRLEVTNQTTLKAPRVLGILSNALVKLPRREKVIMGMKKPPDTGLRCLFRTPNDTQSVAAASQPADGEQTDALTGNQNKDRSRSPGRRRKDIVAETQLDSPDVKQQGTKKPKLGSPNKSFYPPSDPDDAKRKGWLEVDLGGDGDCFYRCISYFLEKDPSKVTPEFAKNAASFIRVKLVAHARKHENRFAEIFPSTRGSLNGPMQHSRTIPGLKAPLCRPVLSVTA